MKTIRSIGLSTLFLLICLSNSASAGGADELIGLSCEVSSRASADASIKSSSEATSRGAFRTGSYSRASISTGYQSSGRAQPAPAPEPQVTADEIKRNAEQEEFEKREQYRLVYIEMNKEILFQESAQGSGDSLGVLGSLYLCQKGDGIRFQQLMNTYHQEIFENLEIGSLRIKNNIRYTMQQFPADVPTCEFSNR